jgi:membrane fusion protein, heavy metal efflux system
MSEDASVPAGKFQTLPVRKQLIYLAAGGGAVVVLVLLLALYHALTRNAPPADQHLPLGVIQLTQSEMSNLTTEPVKVGDDWQQTTATGIIATDETQATPIFLPYSGQVTEVFVEAGAAVAPGQPLLRVRTNDIVDARNALFTAAAQQASARALLRLAEANLHRQEEIYKSAGGALKDYQQAQSDYAAAQSSLRTAESAIGAARDKMAIYGKTGAEIGKLENARDITGIHAETVFHAPIAGVIATRAVSAGQYVASGGDKPVLTIANPDHVWLVAQLAESDAPNVHLGDQVDVTVTAYPGQVFRAVVDNIANGLDPISHRLPVRATVANPGGALKPQMFANFVIRHMGQADSAHQVSVPATAVIHEGDTARVWVAVGNGQFRAKSVVAGDSRNGRVQIRSGISPGERVVTSGSIFVNEAGLGE